MGKKGFHARTIHLKTPVKRTVLPKKTIDDHFDRKKEKIKPVTLEFREAKIVTEKPAVLYQCRSEDRLLVYKVYKGTLIYEDGHGACYYGGDIEVTRNEHGEYIAVETSDDPLLREYFLRRIRKKKNPFKPIPQETSANFTDVDRGNWDGLISLIEGLPSN